MSPEKKLAVLRKTLEITEIRKEGRSFSNRYVVLITKENKTGNPGYALIASRTVGGAVERNRCKRRMRSRVDKFASLVELDQSFLLIARPEMLVVDADTLDKSFKQLFVRAGLIQTND